MDEGDDAGANTGDRVGHLGRVETRSPGCFDDRDIRTGAASDLGHSAAEDAVHADHDRITAFEEIDE